MKNTKRNIYTSNPHSKYPISSKYFNIQNYNLNLQNKNNYKNNNSTKYYNINLAPNYEILSKKSLSDNRNTNNSTMKNTNKTSTFKNSHKTCQTFTSKNNLNQSKTTKNKSLDWNINYSNKLNNKKENKISLNKRTLQGNKNNQMINNYYMSCINNININKHINSTESDPSNLQFSFGKVLSEKNKLNLNINNQQKIYNFDDINIDNIDSYIEYLNKSKQNNNNYNYNNEDNDNDNTLQLKEIYDNLLSSSIEEKNRKNNCSKEKFIEQKNKNKKVNYLLNDKGNNSKIKISKVYKNDYKNKVEKMKPCEEKANKINNYIISKNSRNKSIFSNYKINNNYYSNYTGKGDNIFNYKSIIVKTISQNNNNNNNKENEKKRLILNTDINYNYADKIINKYKNLV